MMRNASRLLAVATFGILVACVAPAAAGPLSLHIASGAPVAGYDRVDYGAGDVLYVAPQAVFTGDTVLSARAIWARGGALVELTMPIGWVSEASVNGPVAMFVKDSPVTVAHARMEKEAGAITITGLSSGQAQRLAAAVNEARSGPTGPVFAAVVSGEVDGLILVDVYLRGANNVRGYEVSVASVGGMSGGLELEDVWVEDDRADYVFAYSAALTAVDRIGQRLAGALVSGTADAIRPAYVGTFAFRPTPDARGTFDVELVTERYSMLRNGAGESVAFQADPAPAIAVAAMPNASAPR
jgi:hypothetical protein